MSGLRDQIDHGAKKHALQMLHNGMFIVTAGSAEMCYAGTVTWVSQASFRPPLVMIALRKSSRLFECLAENRAGALNVLSQGQLELARRLFVHARGREGAFEGERFSAGITPVPVLENAAACLECRVARIVDDAGDHAILIMEVVAAQCRHRDAKPLSVAESPWKYGG
ncbi:MAG TPA: flavin reductase family protein [Gammaproteobacteria bacterium]|nr:flavin reductase family protein [Gammaproteobacteria bacterium]